ncbi:bifunctional 4-hydroxy-2-oxoglutarate aldolase/2-dehydro-3-deoxy-phosphogluconate aldolase [Parvularcula maris]|uniref:2-dehydro-3-deoxy-phosphogluconate aldolase n=1 Tax=Parvularcula maris TaxID=2965077 RepID=A0A9X2LA00_9PROT|nr:bifunctional 4-hydroxy-2-oxoglutarate aldolase/2-dehydro-3-deoxy-phosphogluconate aldolase [Parvularcula maris]MCQ8185841.1 bifunctional 4-hydroxy-2-oxoglutarate aldolase/2-dehydro-3-deoxy-phosphogluconate aldolase [Parvularcula maris]
MTSQAERIDELLTGIPVMPVVVIEDASLALPLADALMAGGIRAMEVTLRTDAALDTVAAIAKERPDMVIGTGTVLSERDLSRSVDAGAQFAVSPGLTTLLANAALQYMNGCPLLPGVATASEAMRAEEAGFERLKFFPAEQAGGAAYLKSIGGPLQRLKFCPTGGISVKTAPDYKKLDNVFTVGGSWLTPKDKMAAGDWAGIEALARQAAGL